MASYYDTVSDRDIARALIALAGAKARCTNPKDRYYKDYGGRGISVCPRWKSTQKFLDDMGPCPAGLTLDRINVNGNYEPGNCRWATMETQNNNRRNTIRYMYGGEMLTLSVIARRSGTTQKSLWRRVAKNGESVEDAIRNTKRDPRSAFAEGRRKETEAKQDTPKRNLAAAKLEAMTTP